MGEFAAEWHGSPIDLGLCPSKDVDLVGREPGLELGDSVIFVSVSVEAVNVAITKTEDVGAFCLARRIPIVFVRREEVRRGLNSAGGRASRCCRPGGPREVSWCSVGWRGRGVTSACGGSWRLALLLCRSLRGSGGSLSLSCDRRMWVMWLLWERVLVGTTRGGMGAGRSARRCLRVRYRRHLGEESRQLSLTQSRALSAPLVITLGPDAPGEHPA
jgi:hypothetical protein